tara:strand:- start:313 stop:1155 length:843 start_codon:yes stop_codon:yes gene_type:complete
MWLSSIDVQLCAKFVFDMEYIGNIEDGLDSCHPWEIAVQCVDTNAKFYCAVWPQLSHTEINSAFTSTADFSTHLLNRVGAKSPGQCYRLLASWIGSNLALANKPTALLISHNCFASDMPILTRHMQAAGASFVCPVLFFDSLLFCRYAYRGVQSDFTLEALFKRCNHGQNIDKLIDHRAISDTIKLNTVLLTHYSSMSGISCFPGSRPLTIVPGIGTSTARMMMQGGIDDVQHIKHLCICTLGAFTVDSCDVVLRNTGVNFATDTHTLAQRIVEIVTSMH